jgi:hypothetical protein
MRASRKRVAQRMHPRVAFNALASRIVAAFALTVLFAAHDAAVAQISLPFKLPPAANDLLKEMQPDALKQKATELAIRNVLDDQLPLRLDATTIYPTVAVLPGGPFKPKPLHLSAADMDSPLPPGDYTMQTLAFCMEYSVHQPGMGTAYVLAPLQGKAADAIGTLLWRGTIQMNKDRQQLQAVSWAIQSGLTYSQMPKAYQAVIDAVIPEYKGEISGNFVQQVQETYQTAAKGTHLPPLEQLLGNLGQPGQLALSAMKQQQVLLRKDTSDQLREQTLFRGQESGVYTPVKAEDGPWTERVPQVAYVRYKIIGGNYQTNNILEIRILPPDPTRTARIPRDGFVRVGYGTQPVSLPPAAPVTMQGLFGMGTGVPVGRGAQILKPVPMPSNPCDLPMDQLVKYDLMIAQGNCACPPAQWNFCASGPVAGKQPVLNLPKLKVYTNMCQGVTVNGILFEPQQLPGTCGMSNTHIWQFVNTAQPTNTSQPGYASGSCSSANNPVSRKYGQWYLDACADPKGDGHLHPELAVPGPNGSSTIKADDQPSGYAADGTPVQKQFYDFMMCGSDVLATWTYTVKGAQQTAPPSCKNKTGPTVASGQEYSDVKAVPIGDPNLKAAICGANGAMSTLPELGDVGKSRMDAIKTAVGCP